MTNIINEYTDESGKSPYEEWLLGLRDVRAKAKIILQVDKMELGFFGDVEPVGEGDLERSQQEVSTWRVM